MIQKFRIGNLNCLCALGSRDRISYVLYPLDDLERWLVTAAAQFEMSIVAITGMDWDDDLTPWPAPGVPRGSADFEGNAPSFLRKLQQLVVPACEKALGMKSTTRNLVGAVSYTHLDVYKRQEHPHKMFVPHLPPIATYAEFQQWRAIFATKIDAVIFLELYSHGYKMFKYLLNKLLIFCGSGAGGFVDEIYDRFVWSPDIIHHRDLACTGQRVAAVE